MATPENIDPLLDAQAAAIAQQAQLAMDTLMVMIAAGINPVDAVKRVQGTFNGAFKAQLQQAFTEVLGHAVSAGHIAALPVTGLPLSARLYRQVQQTSMEVGALVKAHNAGLHDARALAIRLYDGYNPKDGIQRPIEQRSLATLPKPLRELMRADITLKGSYEALLNEVQTAAARLKTGALKAAYTELIDKWIEGKGQESLQRKLDVAFKEKTRFHANRIAQTELARAHQDKVGSEFMQDDTITVVQVVMAPGHPLTDICDYHSRANLFNLGPGCYPKAKAPKPTFHPFCRCIVRSRPDLSAVNAREVSGGDAAYLRSLPVSDAARIVGSRDRLQRVLGGTPLDDVINAGKNPEYHLTRLGQLDLSVVHPGRVPLGSMFPTDNRAMKSEELAILAADLKEPKLSDVQREARVYVVENGRNTGHEYGVAIANDEIVNKFTSGMPNALKVPQFSGYSNGAIDFHHNHPSGDSLSAQDFAMLFATPSIGSVSVHGQSGFFANATQVGAEMSAESAYLIAASTRSKAKALVAESMASGVISDSQSNSGLWPVVMALLLENQGLIRYTINSEAVMSIARKVINHG